MRLRFLTALGIVSSFVCFGQTPNIDHSGPVSLIQRNFFPGRCVALVDMLLRYDQPAGSNLYICNSTGTGWNAYTPSTSSGNSTGISAQTTSTTAFTVTSSTAAGFGDTRYAIPATSTCTVSSSSVDTVYVYINSSGNLVNATSTAIVSCSPAATSVTGSSFPQDVVQIATIAVLANGTLGTLTPLYVGGVAKTVTCSSGCTVTETSTGIGISTTANTGAMTEIQQIVVSSPAANVTFSSFQCRWLMTTTIPRILAAFRESIIRLNDPL